MVSFYLRDFEVQVYELTMRNLIHKYLNSKEEIKQEKIIVVHRDVDINNKLFGSKKSEQKKKRDIPLDDDEEEQLARRRKRNRLERDVT